MIRAIIFDCFGVVITDALQTITEEVRRRNPRLADEIGQLVKAANKGIITPEVSSSQIADMLGTSVAAYRQRIAAGEVKNQPLLDFIASLRPRYKTAMLSNISSGGLWRRFTDDELRQYFDVVVASSDIGFAKPEPQAYEIVADKLGVRLEECVFIDDRETYCDGALAVGMQVILYQDFVRLQTTLEALLANAEH